MDLDKKATQASFAGLIGIARQGVGDLVTRSILKEGGTHREWLLTYCARIREQAAGRAERAPAPTEEAIAAEKLRLTTNQADKTQHEAEKERLAVEVLRGSLRPTDEVESEWADHIAAARAKLLGIPSKAAALVMAAKGRTEVEGILKKLIYAALEELARGDDDAEGDEKPMEPAAKPDGKPVGKRKPTPKPRGQRRTRPVQ